MRAPSLRRSTAALRIAGLVVAVALTGCIPVRYPAMKAAPEDGAPAPHPHAERIEALHADLLTLGDSITDADAAALAEVAIDYPLSLRKDYKLTWPPWIHNGLVNTGIRPRGLCVHWTKDLLWRLADMRLDSFDLYWGVTRYGSIAEHSTVVVTPRGGDFFDGIVLDGWRHSGRLYWSPVTEDRHRWVLHPTVGTSALRPPPTTAASSAEGTGAASSP